MRLTLGFVCVWTALCSLSVLVGCGGASPGRDDARDGGGSELQGPGQNGADGGNGAGGSVPSSDASTGETDAGQGASGPLACKTR